MVFLTAVIHKEEDMYVAKCPELGTVSQGKSIEETLNKFKRGYRIVSGRISP